MSYAGFDFLKAKMNVMGAAMIRLLMASVEEGKVIRANQRHIPNRFTRRTWYFYHKKLRRDHRFAFGQRDRLASEHPHTRECSRRRAQRERLEARNVKV